LVRVIEQELTRNTKKELVTTCTEELDRCMCMKALLRWLDMHSCSGQVYMHCTKNQIYVFAEMKLCGLVPNFHIPVSVSDYIFPGSVCLFGCSKIGRPIPGNIQIAHRYKERKIIYFLNNSTHRQTILFVNNT
jgi:hypothetical protein